MLCRRPFCIQWSPQMTSSKLVFSEPRALQEEVGLGTGSSREEAVWCPVQGEQRWCRWGVRWGGTVGGGVRAALTSLSLAHGGAHDKMRLQLGVPALGCTGSSQGCQRNAHSRVLPPKTCLRGPGLAASAPVFLTCEPLQVTATRVPIRTLCDGFSILSLSQHFPCLPAPGEGFGD